MADHLVALPQFGLLSRSQCEMIHHGALEVLRRTGVRVYHEGALALLRQSGAAVVEDTLVRFRPELVEWALKQVPSRIALCRRGTSQVLVPLQERIVSFGSGSDCLTYLDPRTGERRPFEARDLVDCYHVVDAMPEMQFCMSMGIPSEFGANPFRRQFSLMLEHTSKPIVFVCHDRSDCEAIVAMASAAAGGIDRLRLNPSLLLYTESSSPLRQSETAIDKLLYMAEQALPVLHSPAPVQGATAPVTLAGAAVMANAEVLSGLVIHQLKRAGAPFVYGFGMHHLDMRAATSVYTCPEFMLARVVEAEMGRYYGMPTWGYAGDVNSCVLDEQAAAEATFSIMGSLLTGCNLTHDVGYMEGGRTTSPELVVLCDEIISMLRRFMAGLSLDGESMALDVIDQVGPDGNYLTEQHTLDHFRQLWRPALFSRMNGAGWAEAGSRPLGTVLREKTVAIMESHRPIPLPDKVYAEVERILQ